MTMTEQQRIFHDIIKAEETITNKLVQYWYQYSSFTSIYFWIMAVAIMISLGILIYKIDRQHIFLIGFYGFAIHVITLYIELIGIRKGLFGYIYQISPYIPNFALSAAIIPVSMMLLYQWIYKRDKNYYIYSFFAALFFAFIFKPTIVFFGFFAMYKNTSYFTLFLFYIIIFMLAHWVTKGFLWLQNHTETEVNKMPRKSRNTHTNTTSYRDGLKEGVLNDSTGVQYGIEVGEEKITNPADITKMVNDEENSENEQ